MVEKYMKDMKESVYHCAGHKCSSCRFYNDWKMSPPSLEMFDVENGVNGNHSNIRFY